MHPEDFDALGLTAGDNIRVTWDEGRADITAAIKADPECSRGAVYFTRRIIQGGLKQGTEMGRLLSLRQNPARVRISRAESREG
jgi:formylmethanofuran dehydrogenase subunit D